jgi:hypothetical protein
LNSHIAAVAEMDDHPLEANRSALNANLNRPESAVVPADLDFVVIHSPIHVRIAKHFQTASAGPLSLGSGAESEQKSSHTGRSN